MSDQDEQTTGANEPPEDMLEKALAEGPIPGIREQEAAEEKLQESEEETPVGVSPQDEADELDGFNLRA